ncbi:MAG: tRNA (adenosine(37)-N6)-threonylcarbamoyltransferase complex dimerization subunit type 1 TsaB [Bradyrhizobiaceae bacterium]|nr:MAG: tRNA (adenosine(37)-N6)-threonylcarbamoyltransferase complex dimerization subunit type 1 TsaB [Bradyrhizobiaceae bacterium]
MLVLAIDTALGYCAAAVVDTDSKTLRASETLEMQRGHAEALMPLIGRVMEKFGGGFDALDRIAVTTGPGSFTGLRVGISAARGLALAAGKDVVGVSTLSAYAAPLVNDKAAGPIVVAIDARHDHVYCQVFSGNGATLIKPCVVPVDEVTRAARFGRPRLAGNAANILATRWPDQLVKPLTSASQPGPDISWVAWVGAVADPLTAPARPFYLRAPDAKPKAPSAVRADDPRNMLPD